VDRHAPYRVRFRVPLTVVPPVVGIGVSAALWGDRAELEEASASASVSA
jgi:hypothetical protein